MDRSQGRKKSDFVAKTSVDAGAYIDYFVNGTNYKILYTNFLSGLGVTGTIVTEGDPSGTAVLNVDDSLHQQNSRGSAWLSRRSGASRSIHR